MLVARILLTYVLATFPGCQTTELLNDTFKVTMEFLGGGTTRIVCVNSTFTIICRHGSTTTDPAWLTSRLPGTVLNFRNDLYNTIQRTKFAHSLQVGPVPLDDEWNGSTFTCYYRRGVTQYYSNPVTLYILDCSVTVLVSTTEINRTNSVEVTSSGDHDHILIPVLVPVSIVSTAALITMITCTILIGSCIALAHKRKKRKELEKKEQNIKEIENIAMQTSPAYLGIETIARNL